MDPEETLRLDKWLWVARFFKTRSLAAKSISGGKIHLNGQRTKPGKEVKIGSHIEISKGSYHAKIVVAGINTQRRPAKEAILLYEETSESIEKRKAASLNRQQQNEAQIWQDKRPNKKQRRQIHRFKHE